MQLPTAPDGAQGCAAIGRYLDEPLAGTAARATGWILLEEPGTWGANALADSALPPQVSARLLELTAELPIRAQLIRRPADRFRSPGGPRIAYLAHSGREGPWLRRVELDDPRSLLDLELTTVLRPERPTVGTAAPGPVYLVCTHAKKDTCCSRLGRPLLAELANATGEVWESSHVGGHRFAANLVTLPHGLYFGRLTPTEAARIAGAYAAGHLDVAHLRGRCVDSPPIQAADAALRAHLGLSAVDAVQPRHSEPSAEGYQVTLVAAGTEYTVWLLAKPAEPRLTSCAAVDPVAEVGLHVLDIR